MRSGDIFFDIGANIGVYTIYAALRHPGARVVAFEPEYSNLHLLRDNIIENDLQDRVEVYSVALSNHTGLSHLHIQDFVQLDSDKGKYLSGFGNEVLELSEILMKYEGYIEKESNEANKIMRLEHIAIHNDFDYSRLASLSAEAREKMERVRPKTIGQASRISGVSPSDISILMVYLGR